MQNQLGEYNFNATKSEGLDSIDKGKSKKGGDKSAQKKISNGKSKHKNRKTKKTTGFKYIMAQISKKFQRNKLFVLRGLSENI